MAYIAESVQMKPSREAEPVRGKPVLCTSLDEWKKKTQGQKRMNPGQDDQNKRYPV